MRPNKIYDMLEVGTAYKSLLMQGTFPSPDKVAKRLKYCYDRRYKPSYLAMSGNCTHEDIYMRMYGYEFELVWSTCNGSITVAVRGNRLSDFRYRPGEWLEV